MFDWGRNHHTHQFQTNEEKHNVLNLWPSYDLSSSQHDDDVLFSINEM